MKIGVLLWHILTKLRIEANPNAHINVVEIAWLKNYVHFAIFHLNLPHFFIRLYKVLTEIVATPHAGRYVDWKLVAVASLNQTYFL